MAGRLAGKVAFITGAARGQGRSHAIRLAEEGADIIAADICEDVDTIGYPMSTEDDLAETVKAVQAAGRTIVAAKADNRRPGELKKILDDGVAELGKLDIVCANAGICSAQSWDQVTPEVWRDTLDVNLTGTWNTITAAAPHLIANGGGSVIAISSVAGVKGLPFLTPYVASKHGVVGIVKALANELAEHKIRVNVVIPTGVMTDMAFGMANMLTLSEQKPDLGQLHTNALPDVPAVDPSDISNAVVFLASEESRYVTGLEFKVDAGNTLR